MTYLELDGFLEGGTPYYSEYKFKPLQSSEKILRQFDEERQAFLRDVFRQSSKAKIWCHINLDRAAEAIKARTGTNHASTRLPR